MSKRAAEANDTEMTARVDVARSPAVVLSRAFDDQSFEAIRSFSDGKAAFEPEDVYPFRLIAASDGLDSYFTVQDKDRSLIPMANDLKRGQSVLGNHAYDTFSYGSSFNGEVTSAVEDSRQYEATFNPRFSDNEGLRARHWLVGDYYIVRNVTLNGQPTNDLIRAMELGAVRKVSISFSVGEYNCAICGRAMVPGAGGAPRPDSDAGCLHFPGLDYGGDGLAYARMYDNALLETSMVYKNSSPSAMLLRKAETLAERGILSRAQVATVEERYGVRLPAYHREVWTPGTSIVQPEEESMATKRRRGAEAVPTIPEDSEFAGLAEDAAETPAAEVTEDRHSGHSHSGLTHGGHGIDAKVDEDEDEKKDDKRESEAEAPAVEAEAREAEVEEEMVEEEVTAESLLSDLSTSLVAVLDGLAEAPEAFGDDMLTALSNMANELDAALSDIGAASPSNAIARQYEAKARIVQDILGRALTVESIRSLKADAEIGQRVYVSEVEEAVQARVGVQGEGFDAATYRQMLLQARNFDFVKKERNSWEQDKKARFTPGRQVVPRDLRVEKPSKTAPAEPEAKSDGNILARR